MRRREMAGGWGKRVLRNIYNLNPFCLEDLELEGRWEMPRLRPSSSIPEALFPWDERNKWKEGDGAIHFYCEDREFETCWLKAAQWPHVPPAVTRAGVAIAPDFSLYWDLPKPTQIWNSYRSKLLGALWQGLGVEVIPNASWSDADSFEWAFDGMPVGGTVAIATCCLNSEEERSRFLAGFEEMLRRCQPDTVLVYGAGFKGELERRANVRRYQSRLTQIYERRKAG